MIKKALLIIILLYSFSLYSQVDRFWLYGKVKDSAGVVKNVNIVNLKTKIGTFTNDLGDYKMIVSIGDTLKFTSVQHETSARVINSFIYTSEVLDVYMVNKNYVLDEVILKQHDLHGYLDVDTKKTPQDRRYKALKKTLDFSKVDFSKKLDDDFIDQKVRPPVVRTDPATAFVGAGVKAVIPFKYSERLWALRRDVAHRNSFPNMLISEFGKKFFEDELKIPRIRYYHFLEYCNPLEIEKMYLKGEKIKLINVLREESSKYLKLIEDNEK